MGELKILDPQAGDLKVRWDPDNEAETEAAESQFNDLIDKGFRAYAVKKNGDPGREIKKFNPDAGALIMVPKIVDG